MGDAESKALREGAASLPQTPAFGTPAGGRDRPQRRRRPELLPAELVRAVLQVARGIRKHYSIRTRSQADRAGRLFARALFPRRAGRPKRKDVTRALELEAQGVARARIYVLLGKTTRDQQHALREAMRQRRLRQRRRAGRPPATNPAAGTPTNTRRLFVAPEPALPSIL